VAVVSYGLVFALVESILLFLVAMLLGYLVSVRWEPERRIAAMSVLVLVLSLWAIVGQVFFLLNLRVPGAIIDFLVHAQHPLRVLYVTVPAVVTATFVIPVVLVLRTGRGMRFMTGLIERLSLLALLYLVFDAAALIIVVVRNV
jgi:ABC-type transport system involved in multi-copper enzyme maturation permease subunit